MLIFFIILAAVLLLFVLLLLFPTGLRIIYDDGLTVLAKLGPTVFRIYPLRRRRIRLSQFTKRGYEEKIKHGAEKHASEPTEKKSEKFTDISLLRRAAEEAARFFSGMKVTIWRFELTVAGENAAAAAIKYGAAVQTAAYMVELLNNCTNLSLPHPEALGVRCGFTDPVSTLCIDIAARARVLQILSAAVRFVILYSKYKDKISPKGR